MCGAGVFAGSLNLHQRGLSMKGKMKGFPLEIKDFRCVRCWSFYGFAEFAPREGYGKQNVRISMGK